MQYAHQGFGEILFAVSRGDAHITRRAAAKWVVTDIEPAGFEIKTQDLHQLCRQIALDRDRKRPGRKHRFGARFLVIKHLFHEARKVAGEFAK